MDNPLAFEIDLVNLLVHPKHYWCESDHYAQSTMICKSLYFYEVTYNIALLNINN